MNLLSYVVFTIRNGGMMCRSCVVKLIAFRVIRAGRVTRRKSVGCCRVSMRWSKESVRQDGVAICVHGWDDSDSQVSGRKQWRLLSVETLRRWRR